MRHSTLLTLALLLSAALVNGCSEAPVTGRQQLVLMSDAEAASMGRDAYRDILQKQGIASNPEQTAMVKRAPRRTPCPASIGNST
jgi:hypothetical protein